MVVLSPSLNLTEIVSLVLTDSGRIATAVKAGCCWQPWLQKELEILLLQTGFGVVRQVPYPKPRQDWALNLLARRGDTMMALEVVVEGPESAGAELLHGVRDNLAKVVYYNALPASQRLVLAIGYSTGARAALQRFADDVDNHALYAEQDHVGVLIASP